MAMFFMYFFVKGRKSRYLQKLTKSLLPFFGFYSKEMSSELSFLERVAFTTVRKCDFGPFVFHLNVVGLLGNDVSKL